MGCGSRGAAAWRHTPGQRCDAALAVGLAVFLGLATLLSAPVRGYRVERALRGPMLEGLPPGTIAQQLAQLDPQVTATAIPKTPAAPPLLLLHLTGRDVRQTARRLEQLAQQWREQVLPQQRQSYWRARLAACQAEMAAARQAEQEARHELETLRHQRLAAGASRTNVSPPEQQVEAASVPPAAPLRVPASAAANQPARDPQADALAALQAERARLLARLTPLHPQVVALEAQIAALQELTASTVPPLPVRPIDPAPHLPSERNALPAEPEHRRLSAERREEAMEGPSFPGTAGETARSQPAGAPDPAAAQIEAAERAWQQTVARLEAIQWQQAQLLQRMAGEPGPDAWSLAEPTRPVRLGGRPRPPVLLGVLAVAAAAGGLVYRAATGRSSLSLLNTPELLEDVCRVPVLAVLDGRELMSAGGPAPPRRETHPGDQRFLWGVRLAELVLWGAVAAYLLAVVSEPSLAWQRLGDPLGTLVEVASLVRPT